VNHHVHYRLTRQWALEEGFPPEEALAVGLMANAVDLTYPGSELRYWRYHYRLFGAERDARRHLRAAVAAGSLTELGIALHEVQDSIAHGWLGLLRHFIDPGTDLWDKRSPRVRALLERRSKELLRAYRDGRRQASVKGSDSSG
jgi:hypothetical protein